MDHSKLRVM